MKQPTSGTISTTAIAASLLAVSAACTFCMITLREENREEQMTARRGAEWELTDKERLIGVWRHPADADKVIENALGMYNTSLELNTDGTFSSSIRFYNPVHPQNGKPDVSDIQELSGVYSYRHGFVDMGGQVYSVRFEGADRVRFTTNDGDFNEFSRVK